MNVNCTFISTGVVLKLMSVLHKFKPNVKKQHIYLVRGGWWGGGVEDKCQCH